MPELRPEPVRVPLADVCRTLGVPEQSGVVSGLALDTSCVMAGDLFAALPGARTHGARYAQQAVALGATAILTDAAGAALLDRVTVPVLVVAEPRAQLGALALRIYAAARPRLVGVTGTNGKTTTTYCIAAAAEAAGLPTAVVGTLGVHFRELHHYSGRTTPEAPTLHAALAAMAEAGAEWGAMEVSSHALSLHRVDGLSFAVSAFLGLSQDHLDFHGSMEQYFLAKSRLFEADRSQRAVVNVDDDWGRRLVQGISIPFATYGLSPHADWTARDVTIDGQGSTHFTAVGPQGGVPVIMPLPGSFNVANALAALSAVDAMNGDIMVAARGLRDVRVPGRFERIENLRGIAAYVDYAHTPDAVTRVLEVARAATSGRLIAVLGCGGDRDQAKRPLMGRAAAALADLTIITDDNPRSEDPAEIRRQVRAELTGDPWVWEIGDRATAIGAAVAEARAGDCVMLLGKGHEAGQEIAGVVYPFDDRVELSRRLGGEA